MKYTTNILNIKDYGIVSDRKTDVTHGINKIIQKLHPYTTVRFPKGDYLISKALHFSKTNNLSIVFDEKAVLIPKNKKFDAISLGGSPPRQWFIILHNDVLQNSEGIQTTEPIPFCTVGTYIGIKSNRLLAGLNSRKTYQYEYRKITHISTGLIYTYHVDIPFLYDFLISEMAQIGIATVLDNMTLINPQINTNPDNDTELLGRGIIARHVNHLDIQNPTVFYTKKQGKPSTDYGGLSAIILNACMNSTVTDIQIKHIGWYGVSVLGASYNIIIKKGMCQDTRHAIDASTWITPFYAHQGEPNMVTIAEIESVKSTESGFSTHDTGNKIKFIKCISKESGTSVPSYGFIFRNPNPEASYCTASYATLDGFHCKEGTYHAKIDYPTAYGNNRDGISCTQASADIYEPSVFGNKKSGIYMGDGKIKGGVSLDNSFAIRFFWHKDNFLALENVYAPASEIQNVCFLIDNNPTNAISDYISTQKCSFDNYKNDIFTIPRLKKMTQ